MDKTEAYKLLKVIQDECNTHEDCKECVFYNEGYMCEVNPYAYKLEEG